MDKMELCRLTFNLPKKLVEDIDKYAEKMNLKRTSAITFLITSALQNQDVVKNFNKFVELLQVQAKQEKQERLDRLYLYKSRIIRGRDYPDLWETVADRSIF